MWEWIPAAIGIHMAGAVLVPLNTRYKGVEAGYILGRSGAKVLVTMGEFLGTDYQGMLPSAIDVAHELPALRAVVTLRTDGPSGWDAFLTSGDPVDPGRSSTPASTRSPPTTSRTSSSRREPPGTRRV